MTPDFSPGAGWHAVEGYRIPGSEADLIQRRTRAWRGFVLPIRARGDRLSGATLAACEPIAGGLLLMQAADRWNAYLFELPQMVHELLFLAQARLIKEHDGARQYQGLERTGLHTRPFLPQTWLCATTRERLREITQAMADREWR